MRLTDALEHMPESQRRAILLREWQGLSYHEIADELKLSQSAVETLIFRARRTLASNLESEAKQPGALSRMRKALDGGMLLAAIKGLFEGGAAVKVAAVAVAASGTVVVATAQPGPVSKPAPQRQVQAVQAATPAARVVFERARPTPARSRSRPSTTPGARRSHESAPTRAVATPDAPGSGDRRSATRAAEGEARAQGDPAGPGEEARARRACERERERERERRQGEGEEEDRRARTRCRHSSRPRRRRSSSSRPWRPTSPRATARAPAKRRKRARRSNAGPENRGLH